VITADTIKSYGPEHMVLVLISVLKARRNTTEKQISLDEVSNIYQAICQEYNLERVYSSILTPLKRLDLAGFIKLNSSKKGGTKIIEIGFGENTPEVIENLLYNDPDYAKYKSFEPFFSKNH
jgi:Cdc6-like AAA superfamily ATPase